MVTTFSRTFPGYHKRKGEPTYFVEKFLSQLMESHWETPMYLQSLADLNPNKPFSLIEEFYYGLDFSITDTKSHTIRAGDRWKQGDWFSPRVWSGRPYNSPQIAIAPPVEIKKVWKFEIDEYRSISSPFIGDKDYYDIIPVVAKNDGLYLDDFEDWFRLHASKEKYKPFSGQIICWSEDVKY